MSKSYEKKKVYRRSLKSETKQGMINNAQGKMVPRASITDNSMKRDFMPNR